MFPALRGFECLMFPLWRFLKGQERPVPSETASAIVVPKYRFLCKSHPGLVPQRRRWRRWGSHPWLSLSWVLLNPDSVRPHPMGLWALVSEAGPGCPGVASPPGGSELEHPPGLGELSPLPAWLKPHLNQQQVLSLSSWNCFTFGGIMRV